MYYNRTERSLYVADTYSKYLKGKILDVGCWNKDLKKNLDVKNTDYIGIDIGGDPDIKIDLEKEIIPFGNNTFDCVVCTDVLEHLENLHDVLDKIIKISSKFVIISLPNNWLILKNILLSRKQIGRLKFYGLPVNKPIDRHKWFFNISEAKEFIFKKASQSNCVVSEYNVYFDDENPAKNAIKWFLRMILGRERYENLFATAAWFVIEKKV